MPRPKPIPRSKARRKKRIPGSPGATARARINKLNAEADLAKKGVKLRRGDKFSWAKYKGEPLFEGDVTYDFKGGSMVKHKGIKGYQLTKKKDDKVTKAIRKINTRGANRRGR